MKQYLVIGSGLIGRLLSWRLIQAGHAVDILSSDDKQGTDSAGYVAAAMIAPVTEAVTAEAKVRDIGMQSLKLWPQWLKELPEQIFYQNHGTLVVAHAGDKAELDRYQRRANHVLDKGAFEQLDQQQLTERESELAENFDQAMLFEHEACLDNRQLFQSLGNVLSDSCDWQQCEPVEHLTEQSIAQLTLENFDKSSDGYDAVIDCRGNGARPDLADLRSVRGEVIRVHAPEVSFNHCIRLMHPRYPLYLAPRPNNEYVLGATVVESDDRSPVSVRSGLELMSALYSLHKGFAEARILEMSSHCRPGLSNNMPTIKRSSWGFHLNGFYRHGYLFGPAIITDFLNILNDQTEQVSFGEYYDI
ncbi:FAD-dependent oxidoreductase [Methylophaga sp. 42_25_T18]|nr:FAD-dependent oxidoreductase [Methylophaga sp. 42_25_T18]OUR88433.1 FAD-dependent oxidoreductase [Methylophaga sp. 42_8_T64]